jgi:hypothetical protein
MSDSEYEGLLGEREEHITDIRQSHFRWQQRALKAEEKLREAEQAVARLRAERED